MCRKAGRGYGPEDAQDLTQGFFARLLGKGYLRLADPARGRFRTFLITGLKAFLAETHRQAHRLKRGGGQPSISWDHATAEERYQAEPRDEATPEMLFEKRWAMTLLEAALTRLGSELAADGKAPLFTALRGHFWGDPSGTSYADLSLQLQLSEGALKVTVHRLRRRGPRGGRGCAGARRRAPWWRGGRATDTPRCHEHGSTA